MYAQSLTKRVAQVRTDPAVTGQTGVGALLALLDEPLAPAPLRVTKHRARVVACPDCSQRTRATFPERVAGPVQYGPQLAGQPALPPESACGPRHALDGDLEYHPAVRPRPQRALSTTRPNQRLSLHPEQTLHRLCLQAKKAVCFQTAAGICRFAETHHLIETNHKQGHEPRANLPPTIPPPAATPLLHQFPVGTST